MRQEITQFTPLKLVNIFGAILLILLCWLLYNFVQLNRDETAREQKILAIEEYRTNIIYLDEVLTMSAVTAAVTGQDQWAEKYRQAELQLTSNIEAVLQQVPNSIQEYIQQTEHANQQLISLEGKSLALVEQGKLDQASKILFSEEYRQHKRSYSEGMKQFHSALNKVLIAERLKLRDKQQKTIYGIILVILLAVVSGILLNIIIRGWNLRLKNVMDSRDNVEASLRKQTENVSLLQNIAASANESKSSKEAIQNVLDIICHTTSWPVGHVYLWDSDKGQLVSSQIWHLDDPVKFDVFRQVSEKKHFKIGEGLPGRVYQDKIPIWVMDVMTDSNFPRNKLAKEMGVRGAFALPVLVEQQCVAVMEFFAPEVKQPNEELLVLTANIGVQLGRSLEREEYKNNLVEKTRILEEANEELEHFAYIASHDLQEPLRMVSSYTQLLAKRYEEKLDKEGKEFINFAVDGAKRMQELIQDLLHYSRLSTRGKEFTEVNSNELFDNSIRNLEVLIDETGTVVTRDNLPAIFGDKTQLQQLFQNLIGNAIKYRNPEKMNKVHVSSGWQDGRVIFYFDDNGIGIEEKYYKKIFLLFKRLHNRQEYSGTGIGLTICKRIVKRHGGDIWLESIPDGGSRFYFSLPNVNEIIA